MFDNNITITTPAKARTFAKNFVEGYNTTRVETTAGVPSNQVQSFVIKHDADPKKKTKPNRRLIQLSGNEIDVLGVARAGTVHLVITQPKEVSDAYVLELAAEMVEFLTPANVALLLKGGN